MQTAVGITFSNILTFIQTASVVIAIIIGLRSIKGGGDSKIVQLTKMASDIEYIKENVKCLDPLKDKINEVDKKATTAYDMIDAHIKRHQNEGS